MCNKSSDRGSDLRWQLLDYVDKLGKKYEYIRDGGVRNIIKVEGKTV